MDVGFDTIGNATLICYDKGPVLVTDPWVTGTAYFGSWKLFTKIPDEQMEAIRPLYDQYAASTSALHDLELGAEDLAVTFTPAVEPGDGAAG